MESTIRTSHCCFCSMQCGMEITESGQPGGIKIKASRDFPVATGRLCQKGLNAHEHVLHPERVKEPLSRPHPGAAWQKTGWDDTIRRISAEILSLQQQYGKDAIAVYGGGSLTNEVCYLLGKFARVALGTRYIDYNGRFCMSSAAAAANQAFGIDRGMTFPLSDLSETDYIILAGTNIAENQPTMVPYLLEAKKKGAVIVTIDPRNTLTSKLADIHVRLQPGFDSVFVNGLLHVMLKEKLYDAGFVRERTDGLDSLAAAVELFSPDRVEEVAGVLSAVTRTVARGFAAAKRGIVLTARGMEQQINGVENTLNYINLCLLTGKIGRPGCGYGAVTGQANGQGGREHGQKADQLPGYRSIENPEHRRHVAEVWGVDPDSLPGKGVSAYELLQKIHEGEIKGMIVLGSNPAVSSPNSRRAEEALAKLELLVVADLFETETAAYAHYLLPGAAFLESEGTLTNLEGRVFHRPQVLEPPGEACQDYRLICGLAASLGKGAYFNYTHVEDIFEELKRASAGGKADYAGMSYERLQSSQGLFWPCPSADHGGTPRMFEDLRFFHPDGKARIIGITPKYPGEVPDREYPYVLTTGRLANHYLSGAQTRRTEALNRKAPEPAAEIHPTLAEKIGLTASSLIRLTSRRGSVVLKAKITEQIHPRTVFVPFHWGGKLGINQLTHDALDPVSRMPEFKICAVRVEKETVMADAHKGENGEESGSGQERDGGREGAYRLAPVHEPRSRPGRTAGPAAGRAGPAASGSADIRHR